MAKNRKRPDGTGSIFKLKGGGFRVRVNMDVREGGRVVRKRVERRAKTKAEANAKLAELLKQKSAGYVAPEAITVGSWIDEWLKLTAERCRPKTLSNYTAPMQVFREWFGKEKLKDLDILALREMVRQQPSEYGRYDLRRKVKACLQQAVRDKRISENPMDNEALQKPRPKKDPFSTEERIAICKAAGELDLRNYGMIVLALFVGPRLGELLGLEWQDWRGSELDIARQVSEESGVFETYPPKRESARTIDLAPQLQNALAERRKTAMVEGLANCTIMFPDTQGHHQRKSNFYRRVWGPLLKKAGVRHRNFHQTRHTAIVHMLAVEDVQSVAQMAGHASIETTMREYSSYLPEHRKSISDSARRMMEGLG